MTDWKKSLGERQEKDLFALFSLVAQTKTNPPRTQEELLDVVEEVADLYYKRHGVRIFLTPDRKAVVFRHEQNKGE